MGQNNSINNQEQIPTSVSTSQFTFFRVVSIAICYGILCGILGYTIGLNHYNKTTSLPLQNDTKNTSVVSPTNSPVSNPQTTLVAFSNNFKLGLKVRPWGPPDISWKDDNGITIPLMAWYLWGGPQGINISQTQADMFFQKQGFKKSHTQSDGNWATDDTYENNEVKCGYHVQGNVLCGVIDQREIAWKQELASLINSQNNSAVTFWTVDYLDGNYAQGGREYGPSGAAWLAMKTKGKWKFIEPGYQNILGCSLMKKYNVPKDVYRACGSGY